ncbi:sulfatase-like hydrolase/transferase [Sphingorhabdus contaminans]|uniref:sulfatase-like hydrolase/transferase n=1 Tax=Sphingorhabdus contaminans TaxID=1343899 RepID=UPI003D27C1F0
MSRKPTGPTDISRRGAMGLMAAIAAVETARAAPTGQGRRPNILWLVSEDNNPLIGAYGDKLAHTPTIDALAAKGLLYRNVYSNAPVCAPSRFAILTGIHPESCAPANQMRANAHLPGAFKTYPELLRQAGYFCTNNAKTDYNCDRDPAALWDIQGAQGHWRKRPDSRPFMAVFNFETTHEVMLFRPTKGRVTPDMVNVPPYLPDTPGVRQDFASYYNLMEKMDAQLAARLAELEADGLIDDTIVFHYSDNGGVLGRSKRYCYDEGLRCALIVHVPEKWRHLMPAGPGSVIDNPVTFIDLAPTLLALAGVSQPPQMPGRPLLGKTIHRQRYAFGMRNRMDERIDFQRTVTDGRWRYIRNYMPHRPWGQHQAFQWLAKGYQDWEAAHRAATLSPVQDRFFQTKPYEELYDLAKDPHQIDNLAQSPAARAKYKQLAAALDAHMQAINDNGFLPETMAGEGYFESRDRSAYPLRQVMALAATAAKGAPEGIGALRAALRSPVPVLRYWAATGLLIRGRQAAPDVAALRGVLSADPSPLVRIVAAEALVRLGEDQDGVRVLAGLAADTAPWQVRLHALNALTCIGEPARAARGVIADAATSDQEYVRNAARYLVAVLDGTYTPAMPIFDLQRLLGRAGPNG